MWQQVAGYLRGEILTGAYPAGQLLPSEETLATEFGVSRPTVRQGIQALAAEGLVEIRRPRGTMVRDPHAAPARTEHRTLDPACPGSDQDWADTGQPAFYRADATADLAGLLAIPPGEPLLVRQTLQAAADGLRRLARLCMPFSVAAHTPWADDPHLLAAADVYRHFTRAGHVLTVTEYVRARMPIGDETTTLAVPAGTPLLIATRVTSATIGGTCRPLALHETSIRADHIQLAYTTLAGPPNATAQPK
jgi:GntR family transcriptional regulator